MEVLYSHQTPGMGDVSHPRRFQPFIRLHDVVRTNECLVNLRNENPTLWNDLQTKSTRDYGPGDEEEVLEDPAVHEDEELGDDDSEIPTHEVVQHVVTKKTAKNRTVKATKSKMAVGLRSSGEAPHRQEHNSGPNLRWSSY